jgi:Uma2 family endonuclease
MLDAYVSGRRIGRVGSNETGLHVKREPPRSRGADVVFISYQRLPADQEPEGFLTVPPELVVEVLGLKDSWEEMLDKVKDYHEFGVDMVWVADPHTRSVKKFPRGGAPMIVHEGQDIDGGSSLPGLKVSVAKFFED